MHARGPRAHKNSAFNLQAPVVQTLDSAIQRITQFFPVIRISWIVIYPVDSAIQLLNNLVQFGKTTQGARWSFACAPCWTSL